MWHHKIEDVVLWKGLQTKEAFIERIRIIILYSCDRGYLLKKNHGFVGKFLNFIYEFLSEIS